MIYRITRVIIYTILAVGYLMIAMTCLSGCEATVSPSPSITQYEYSDFKLICDNKTGIVYIDNTIKIEGGDTSDKWYHIYTPYYSKNGRICRYDDNKMIEITEETTK